MRRTLVGELAESPLARLLGKIISNVTYMHDKKRLAKNALETKQVDCSPGIWALGVAFSKKLGSDPLPQQMRHAKQWGAWRKGRLIKRLRRVVELATPPWLVYVKTSGEAKYSADALLVTRTNDVYAFDFKNKKVVKHLNRQRFHQLNGCYHLLSGVYPCASAEFLESDCVIIESLCSGVLFSHLDTQQQCAYLRRLLNMQLRSGRVEGVDRPYVDVSRPLVNTLQQYGLSDVINSNEFKNALRIQRRVVSAKLHGDLYAENIIIEESGFILIDLDKAQIGPMFADLINLLVMEAFSGRATLLERFFAGHFDEYLCECIDNPKLEDVDRLTRWSAIFLWMAWKLNGENLQKNQVLQYLSMASNAEKGFWRTNG
jgi:hypothetical protein